MKFKLLSISALSFFTANAFALSDMPQGDIDISMSTKVPFVSVSQRHWATVQSKHCLKISNNTNERKSFKYYLKLCVPLEGCKDSSKDITVNPHSSWGNTCNTLEMSKYFSQPATYIVTATTELSGDAQHRDEATGTIQVGY